MNWRKLGKIFDSAQHASLKGREFAQSPQALVFDDFVRIYFSVRSRDNAGKYLSHVAFVDFTKDFSKEIKVCGDVVIPLGELGCFDEHGIFPTNVLRDDDRILAFTTGWNRKASVSADAAIGLAVSENGGESFVKYGTGPILTSSLNEPFLVCDAFVRKFGERYHMWYIFGLRWLSDTPENEPQRVYKISHATSEDCIEWVRESRQIVEDKLNPDECQALPSVIRIKDTYHMFFCYRQATDFRKGGERSYRIGYAYSKDLVSWTRDDSRAGIEVSESGWDSEMMCYPHIFQCDEKIYLLYNGNEFGKYGFGLAVLAE